METLKRKEEESKEVETHLFNNLQKKDESYESKEKELPSLVEQFERSQSRSRRISKEIISVKEDLETKRKDDKKIGKEGVSKLKE